MLASDHRSLARHADPVRATSVFQRSAKPRRALTTTADRTRAGRTVVGMVAGAAVVGGLALANPAAASAQSIGHDLPKLHKGASNSLVNRLQRELSAYGPNVSDTGYFGNLTKKRVKRLQRKHGWKATGVAGPRVWHVLLTDGHRVSRPSIKPYESGHHKKKAPKKKHSGGSSAGSTSVWDRIAQCESGGNWHINTGNGYYGGLQFTLQTWHAFGGSGMPNEHSRANQIAIARRVQRSQGWGAWPVCSRQAGV